MSIERIFYCDGPDCKGHIRTASPRPRGGFYFLTYSAGGPTLHFCTLDCIMKYAAEFPPTEIIPMNPPKDEDDESAASEGS